VVRGKWKQEGKKGRGYAPPHILFLLPFIPLIREQRKARKEKTEKTVEMEGEKEREVSWRRFPSCIARLGRQGRGDKAGPNRKKKMRKKGGEGRSRCRRRAHLNWLFV